MQYTSSCRHTPDTITVRLPRRARVRANSVIPATVSAGRSAMMALLQHADGDPARCLLGFLLAGKMGLDRHPLGRHHRLAVHRIGGWTIDFNPSGPALAFGQMYAGVLNLVIANLLGRHRGSFRIRQEGSC